MTSSALVGALVLSETNELPVPCNFRTVVFNTGSGDNQGIITCMEYPPTNTIV